MQKKLSEFVQSLTGTDKWLLGVSGVVLVNSDLAVLAALIIFGYYIYKLVKKLKE